jgi:hypothetical protein
MISLEKLVLFALLSFAVFCKPKIEAAQRGVDRVFNNSGTHNHEIQEPP